MRGLGIDDLEVHADDVALFKQQPRSRITHPRRSSVISEVRCFDAGDRDTLHRHGGSRRSQLLRAATTHRYEPDIEPTNNDI